MEIIFHAIGIEIPNKTAFHNLAENAERNGEASIAERPGRIVRGSCWRIGFGLEVWTTLNESESGEVFYTHCRPAFRARRSQILSDWRLSETKGDAVVEGFVEKHPAKISFQLQNLTEISARRFEQKFLRVGLCGLAYRAEISTTRKNFFRKPAARNPKINQADWHLRGEILAFDKIRNLFSNTDLFWIQLDLGSFELEILINQRALAGDLRIGANIEADIWLQGHIAGQVVSHSNYEGVDWSQNSSDFWRKLKREN